MNARCSFQIVNKNSYRFENIRSEQNLQMCVHHHSKLKIFDSKHNLITVYWIKIYQLHTFTLILMFVYIKLCRKIDCNCWQKWKWENVIAGSNFEGNALSVGWADLEQVSICISIIKLIETNVNALEERKNYLEFIIIHWTVHFHPIQWIQSMKTLRNWDITLTYLFQICNYSVRAAVTVAYENHNTREYSVWRSLSTASLWTRPDVVCAKRGSSLFAGRRFDRNRHKQSKLIGRTKEPNCHRSCTLFVGKCYHHGKNTLTKLQRYNFTLVKIYCLSNRLTIFG